MSNERHSELDIELIEKQTETKRLRKELKHTYFPVKSSRVSDDVVINVNHLPLVNRQLL